MKELLEKINWDLGDLPPPPSCEPLSEVLRLITKFSGEVRRQGEGIPGRDGLLHQIKQPRDDFRVAIRRTAPCFVPQYRSKTSGSEEVAIRGPVLCAAPHRAYEASGGETFYAPQVEFPVKATPHPPFLVGEEDSKEIELNDGKEVFIDDVLETAEWCVPRLCNVSLTHNKHSEQCSHTRAAKQLPLHSPEGVHPYLR